MFISEKQTNKKAEKLDLNQGGFANLDKLTIWSV